MHHQNLDQSICKTLIAGIIVLQSKHETQVLAIRQRNYVTTWKGTNKRLMDNSALQDVCLFHIKKT